MPNANEYNTCASCKHYEHYEGYFESRHLCNSYRRENPTIDFITGEKSTRVSGVEDCTRVRGSRAVCPYWERKQSFARYFRLHSMKCE